MKKIRLIGKRALPAWLLVIILVVAGAGAAAGTVLAGKVVGEVPIAVSQAILVGEPVIANDLVQLQTKGDGEASWSTAQAHTGSYSAELYVPNGGTDWAAVQIPVDIPIEDISTLTFWEEIHLMAVSGWDVAVYLGVDTDHDGVFRADIGGWHVGPGAYTPGVLGGDSFVGNDGQLGKPGGLAGPGVVPWTQVDALATYAWSWATSPNVAGTGIATWGWQAITNFADFLALLPTGFNDSRIQLGDRVKVVELAVGGSGAWMNETAFVDDVTINGVFYPLDMGDLGGIATVPQGTQKHFDIPNRYIGAVSDDNTMFQFASEIAVGDLYLIALPLKNASENDLVALLTLDVPDCLEVEVVSADQIHSLGNVTEAVRIGLNTWKITVLADAEYNPVGDNMYIAVQADDYCSPGYYTISGDIKQIPY